MDDPGDPEPADSVGIDELVRTDDRFLMDKGSMILGGFAGSALSALALGVVSVLGTLVGSNG